MSKKFPFEDVDEEYVSEAQAKVIIEDFILRNSIVPDGWEDEMSEEMKIEHLKGIELKALEPGTALRLRALPRRRTKGEPSWPVRGQASS